MAVSAKFQVSKVAVWGDGDPDNDENVREVEMTPDYAQGANAEWASASPSGLMRITIQNPAAFKQLTQGKKVDITLNAHD